MAAASWAMVYRAARAEAVRETAPRVEALVAPVEMRVAVAKAAAAKVAARKVEVVVVGLEAERMVKEVRVVVAA